MDTRKPVSLAIVGPFSSGKSTLLNALVGEAVQSMGVLPETSMLSHLTWSATRGGRIHLADGRTVDGTFEETRARVMEIEQSGGAGTVDHVEHSLPKTFLQHLHLWDTPGLNSTYLHHEIVAERAIRTADIIVWVTPIDAAITREEVEKIAKRKPPKTPLLVVVNKIDVADEGELADALAGIRKDLEGVVTTVQPVAARAALDRAEGAASEFRGDDGIAGLRQAIAGFVSAAQHERAWPAGIARSLKASEFECPTCSEACDASDKYCVCGRDLADQHRECPRCAGDNIMRRDRCRQCNVVFAVAEQSDEVERQAIEDLAHFALTDASVKLRAAVELDSSVPGRVGLRDAIGKAATQLQDIVDGVANFLRDGDARWFAEAVRADSLLPVSALKVALHFASSGPYATKAQRQRRQLCEQWVCSKSAFEAVLFGVKDDIIRVLGYAWMLAASFELQETAKARHIADSLASATCVIEWESMGSRKDHGSLEMHKIAALVLSACDATEQEDYERALCCLESAAVEPSLLERLLAVARRAGELCAARDARDATIGDIVAKLVSEGYSALEGGRLSLVKECARKADNAALTASVSRRGALRSASMLLVERVDLALEESRKLSRQAEECNGREEFEEQIRLLTLAAETNVAYRDTLLTARQEYRSKLAAREARNAALARVLVGFSRAAEMASLGHLVGAEAKLSEVFGEEYERMRSADERVVIARMSALRNGIARRRDEARARRLRGCDLASQGDLRGAIADYAYALALDASLESLAGQDLFLVYRRARFLDWFHGRRYLLLLLPIATWYVNVPIGAARLMVEQNCGRVDMWRKGVVMAVRALIDGRQWGAAEKAMGLLRTHGRRGAESADTGDSGLMRDVREGQLNARQAGVTIEMEIEGETTEMEMSTMHQLVRGEFLL